MGYWYSLRVSLTKECFSCVSRGGSVGDDSHLAIGMTAIRECGGDATAGVDQDEAMHERMMRYTVASMFSSGSR